MNKGIGLTRYLGDVKSFGNCQGSRIKKQRQSMADNRKMARDKKLMDKRNCDQSMAPPNDQVEICKPDKKSAFSQKYQEYLKRKREQLEKVRKQSSAHPPFYVGGSGNVDKYKSKIPMLNSSLSKGKTPAKMSKTENICDLSTTSTQNLSTATAKPQSTKSELSASKDTKIKPKLTDIATKLKLPVEKKNVLSHTNCTDASVSRRVVKVTDNVQLENEISNTKIVKGNETHEFNFSSKSQINVSSIINAEESNADFINTNVNQVSKTTKPQVHLSALEKENINVTESILLTSENISIETTLNNPDLSNRTHNTPVRRSKRSNRFQGSFSMSSKNRRSQVAAQAVIETKHESTGQQKTDVSISVGFSHDDSYYTADFSLSDSMFCNTPHEQTSGSPIRDNPPKIFATPDNCSNMIDSDLKRSRSRRKTMTPGMMSIDLIKPPEICFTDLTKTPSSILRLSNKNYTSATKSVHFNDVKKASFSDPAKPMEEIVEENIDNVSDIQSRSRGHRSRNITESKSTTSGGEENCEHLISPFLRTRRSVYQMKENLIEF